ncbi:MAG: nucleotidyltransferase family protein [bacterium]|nr:nucleotidyltransferase family protein [bacterium]
MNVVVLAGGRNRDSLYEATGAANKALIKLADKPMAEYVVSALKRSRQVERVALVGPAGMDSVGADIMLPDKPTLLENVNQGMTAFPNDEYLLVATADIPLLTPRAVDDFVGRAQRLEADIVYPIVSRAVSENRFPGQKRTYVRLREGAFTGGNLMLVHSRFIRQQQALIEQVYAMRKQPLKLAGILGFSLVLRLVLGLAGLPEVEQAAGRLIRGKAKAMVTTFPEVAFDVDKPSDLEAVKVEFFRLGGRIQ